MNFATFANFGTIEIFDIRFKISSLFSLEIVSISFSPSVAALKKILTSLIVENEHEILVPRMCKINVTRLDPSTREREREEEFSVYELTGLLRNRPVAGGCSISPYLPSLFYLFFFFARARKRTRPA